MEFKSNQEVMSSYLFNERFKAIKPKNNIIDPSWTFDGVLGLYYSTSIDTDGIQVRTYHTINMDISNDNDERDTD